MKCAKLFLFLIVGAFAAIEESMMVKVMVENLIENQPFSPAVFVVHSSNVSIATIGEEASEDIRYIAEDGDNSFLLTTLDGLMDDGLVFSYNSTDGAIEPGMSGMIDIQIPSKPQEYVVSMATMLVNTNDHVALLLDVPLRKFLIEEQLVGAYDAGTEENTELCDNIPGPGCEDTPNDRSEAGAEGTIEEDVGIEGIGDLDDSFNWNITEPVAAVYVVKAVEVNVTNLLGGQPFSPVLCAVHDPSIAIAEVGEPVIDEVTAIAEDGDAMPLYDLLMGNLSEYVLSADVTDGPVAPMESGSLSLYVPYSEDSEYVVSCATMLVNTNDHMAILFSEPVYSFLVNATMANGYNAGTEDDNELCANIPGPACPEDSGNERAPPGEGTLEPDTGVVGGGDLDVDEVGWDIDEPVAMFTTEYYEDM